MYTFTIYDEIVLFIPYICVYIYIYITLYVSFEQLQYRN